MNKSTAVSFVRNNPVIGAQLLGILTRSDDDSSVDFQPQTVTGLVTLGQHRLATQTTVSVRLARDGTASQSRPTSTDTMPDAIRANWYELAISRLSVDAFARLNFLATKQAGWRGPGSMALKGDSVSEFLRFWSAVRADAAEPELMLTPMGTLQAEWLKNSEGARRYHSLLKMRDLEIRAAVSLATKLRLTNHSRYDAKTAATASKNAAKGFKPWDL